MLSVLASILKIILGSLVANYFNSVFAGGWWAGAVLLIASLTGIFSFTGLLLQFNIVLHAFSLLLCTYAVVVDSFLADYFNFPYHVEISCSCSQSREQYRYIDYYIADGNCANIFARNPQLLIINAALSALCFFSALLMFILLCLAIGCRWFYRNSDRWDTLTEYTVTV